jgi:urease accessory protein UreE
VLQVFKTLPVARETCRADGLPARAHAYVRDTITLGWEDRLKARGRRRSDGGLEFGTALSRGTVLVEGDCFVIDESARVVAVIERGEAVFVIVPATAAEWGRFAYCIGNSHQPIMIQNDAIICPDASGMEQVLTYHGIPFSRSVRPFTPLGPAGGPYAAGHQHQP